jgi:hypothetical protein
MRQTPSSFMSRPGARKLHVGRVVPVGKGFIRKPPKRVDFLLRYMRLIAQRRFNI